VGVLGDHIADSFVANLDSFEELKVEDAIVAKLKVLTQEKGGEGSH
jgi:hypothetical protein